MPDDALLAAAAAATCSPTPACARRPSACSPTRAPARRSSEFFAQFLDLGRLDGITRDPVRYPLFTPTMIESMRTEVELLVDDLIYPPRRRHPQHLQHPPHLREQRARRALRRPGPRRHADHLRPRRAARGRPARRPPDPRRLPDDERPRDRELADRPRQVRARARAVPGRARAAARHRPEPRPEEATRARPCASASRSTAPNPTCAGCHAFIDPPGFLFEHFDPIGAWRDLDNGQPIDASGDLDGMPLADARGLAELLKDDKRVGRCMVTQLYRHAIGRRDRSSECPGARRGRPPLRRRGLPLPRAAAEPRDQRGVSHRRRGGDRSMTYKKPLARRTFLRGALGGGAVASPRVAAARRDAPDPPGPRRRARTSSRSSASSTGPTACPGTPATARPGRRRLPRSLDPRRHRPRLPHEPAAHPARRPPARTAPSPPASSRTPIVPEALPARATATCAAGTSR
jgi:hypothetical protein